MVMGLSLYKKWKKNVNFYCFSPLYLEKNPEKKLANPTAVKAH